MATLITRRSANATHARTNLELFISYRIVAIMVVWELPPRLSFSRKVSTLSLSTQKEQEEAKKRHTRARNDARSDGIGGPRLLSAHNRQQCASCQYPPPHPNRSQENVCMTRMLTI